MNKNKKYIAILIICFCNILLLFSESHAFRPYGPKIMGLQLGMDYEVAKNAIEDIANRYNDLSHSSSHKVFTESYKNGEKGIHIGYGLATTSFSKNEELYKYQLSGGSIYLFNTPNFLEKEFLQSFINHYNIPKISFRDGLHGPEYYYIDYDNHWEIVISRISIDVFHTNQKKPQNPTYNFN